MEYFEIDFISFLDKVLVFGSGDVETILINSKQEEINRMILKKLNKGSTLIPIQKGYAGEQ